MNIFYLHNDQHECAKMHPDKHVVKMILEYAQLLSTAHRVLDGILSVGSSPSGRKKTTYALMDERNSILYASTHINHPSAIWVRQSQENYKWLHRLLVELCKEYTYRYDKVHKVEASGLLHSLYSPPLRIPNGAFTEPTPAMPDEYKVPGNSVQAYINYYLGAKRHLANWKKRSIPSWYVTT